MRTFQGQTVVIKYGGAAQQEPELKSAFAQDITLLQYLGIHPVVVHGGGPQIGKVLAKMDIPTRFVDGMRVTDESTMDVVEMVLAGKINKEIVNLINTAGGAAVGLSGKDGLLLQAQKLEFYRPRDDEPPEIIDIGLVGEVTAVNTNLIRTLQGQHFIPVIAPVGVGDPVKPTISTPTWWPERWPGPWAPPSSFCSPTCRESWTGKAVWSPASPAARRLP